MRKLQITLAALALAASAAACGGGSDTPPESKEVKAGETAEIVNFDIKVNDLTDPYESSTTGTGNTRLVLVDLTVSNTGKDPLMVSDTCFTMTDAEGHETVPVSTGNSQFEGVATPGKDLQGEMIFPVNVDVAPAQIKFESCMNDSDDGSAAILDLNDNVAEPTSTVVDTTASESVDDTPVE